MKQQAQSARRRSSVLPRPENRTRTERQESSISTLVPRIDDVVRLVKSDYPGAARLLQRRSATADNSVRELSYLRAVGGYVLGRILERDDNAWKRFKQDDAMRRQAKLTREHCLRYALMYMHGSATGKIAAHARHQARALNELWEKGVSALQVYERLQEGGFEGLLKSVGKVTAASGIRGRKAQPIFIARPGCVTLEALEPAQIAINIIELVPRSGKRQYRSLQVVRIDRSRQDALRSWLKDAKRAASPARGRRHP